MASILGVSLLNSQGQIIDHSRITIDQALYQDSSDDYAERVYLFNTGLFRLNDEMRFVVDDGAYSLTNVAVRPFDEDYDFDGSGLAAVFNQELEPLIDPSQIGRIVNIQFDNSSIQTQTVYTASDYNNDNSVWNGWLGAQDLAKLIIEGDDIIEDLWDGLTAYMQKSIAAI